MSAKPISSFTDKQRHLFLYGEVTKVKISGINMTYEGLIPKITKSMLSKDLEALQPHIRAFVERVARAVEAQGASPKSYCAVNSGQALQSVPGFEGAPDLVARIGARHRLLGAGPETIAALKDPFRFAALCERLEIPHPAVTPGPVESPEKTRASEFVARLRELARSHGIARIDAGSAAIAAAFARASQAAS